MALLIDCVFSGGGYLEGYAIPGYSRYAWRRVSPSRVDVSSLALTPGGVAATSGVVSDAYILWDVPAGIPAVFAAPVTVEIYGVQGPDPDGYGAISQYTGVPAADLFDLGGWTFGYSAEGTRVLYWGSGSVGVKTISTYGPPRSNTIAAGSFGVFSVSSPWCLAKESVSGGALAAHRINGTPIGTTSGFLIPDPSGVIISVDYGSLLTRVRLFDNADPTPPEPPEPPGPMADWWTNVKNALTQAE